MALATGAITGTPNVTSSATTYTVTVTDANGATATAAFSLTVNSAVTATQAIASTMLTQNHAATSFKPVTGSGGTGTLTYSVSPGLPAGLSMAPGTGAITGTPGVASSATTYTVTVTDTNGATATATFSLTVNGVVTATQAIASTTLTVNVAATPFTPVTGSGGTTPLAYSVSPGLPTGLSMAAGTGAITGTPNVTSSATTYTVTVTDANSVTATATFSLTVAAPTPLLAVAVSGSPASVVSGNDITYSIALTVSTGTATNASLSDPLPAGLTFVSAGETGPGGVWTCTTPAVGAAGTVTCSIASAAPGTYNFTIVAQVAAGTPAGPVINTATASASKRDDPIGKRNEHDQSADPFSCGLGIADNCGGGQQHHLFDRAHRRHRDCDQCVAVGSLAGRPHICQRRRDRPGRRLDLYDSGGGCRRHGDLLDRLCRAGHV